MLAKHGVPGSKYLDQGSRNGDAATLERSISEMQRRIEDTKDELEENKNNPSLLPAYFERRRSDIAEMQARISQWQSRLNEVQQPTHNFVVFDHDLVEITHKNGEAVPTIPDKLKDMWQTYGIHPYEAVEAAANSPVMRRDLSSATSPPLPIPARPSKNYLREVDDNFHRLRGAHTADQAEMLNMLDTLPSNVKDAEMQRKWYHYGEGDPEVRLTPEEGKLYNETMIPLKKEEAQLLQ